jgi:hypothetical protein
MIRLTSIDSEGRKTPIWIAAWHVLSVRASTIDSGAIVHPVTDQGFWHVAEPAEEVALLVSSRGRR